MATLKVRRVGNSQGVILPKEVLQRVGVDVGDELTVSRLHTGELRLCRKPTEPAEATRAMEHRHLREAGFDTPEKVHSAMERGSYKDMRALLIALYRDPQGPVARACESAAAHSDAYGWPRVISMTLQAAREHSP